jgi:hypothetical protein
MKEGPAWELDLLKLAARTSRCGAGQQEGLAVMFEINRFGDFFKTEGRRSRAIHKL